MPRRRNRPPTRNPRGLGAIAEEPRNASPDGSPRPSTSRNHRRRSLSESNLPSPAAERQARPRAASAAPRGAKALQEIRRLQQSTGPLIPKLPFARVIREVLLEYSGQNLRITPEALEALQEAAETYLVLLFEDCQKLALHRYRVTIMKQDMDLALYFRVIR